MKTFVAIAIWAVVPVCLFGQASRVDPNPTLTVGYAPPTAYPPVLAIPGAFIALCSDPACTTRATTYTSAAATSTCPASAQVVLAGGTSCVSNSDNRGNFGFWVSSGTYYYQITVGGKMFGPFPLSVGGSGGGGGGNVFGSGTPGFSARWTSSSTIATGGIQDNGNGLIGIGAPADQILTLSSPSGGTVLHIVNLSSSGFGAIRFRNDTGTDVFSIGLNGSVGGGAPQMSFSQPLSIFPGGVDTIWINPSGTADQTRIYGTGGFNVGSTAELATPSAGYGKLWFDSTNLTFQGRNVTGAMSTMVFPQICGGATVVGGVNANGTLSCVAGGGGAVISVGLALPVGVFNVSNSPVTSAGTLTAAFVNQNANTGFFGPSSGSPGVPGFRPLVLADLPSIASTNLADSSTLVRNNTSNAYTTGSQDFTNAAHLVAKNGTIAAKPATCAVGEVYFATDASAGQNWFFCTSANTWTPQAGGGGGTANVPTATFTSGTATLFGNCSGSGCNVSEGGNQVQNFTATNTATAPVAGTGSLYVYWAGASSCQAVLSGGGSAVTLAGSGPCSGITSTSGSGFPNNATAVISRLDYSGAVWTGVVNYQPTASNPPVITTGTGILQTLSAGLQQLAIDTSVIPTYSGSAQNFVPHYDSSLHNLVDGLIQDDGTNGVGVGGAASTQSGFQERFSIINNSPPSNLLLNGIHSTSTGYIGEWEIYDYTGSAHAAFGVNTDHTVGFTYFAGIGPVGMQFATANGDYVFGARGSAPGTTSTFKILGGGGITIVPTTVSSLPTCGSASAPAGTSYPVSDATSPTYGGALTGGGGVYAIALCNASATWTAH